MHTNYNQAAVARIGCAWIKAAVSAALAAALCNAQAQTKHLDLLNQGADIQRRQGQLTDPILVNTDPTNQPVGRNAAGTYGNNSAVWAQPPLVRGGAIESELSKTDYSPDDGWCQVGAENNGYFPLVDFQKGNVLVNLKSVNTSWWRVAVQTWKM